MTRGFRHGWSRALSRTAAVRYTLGRHYKPEV